MSGDLYLTCLFYPEDSPAPDEMPAPTMSGIKPPAALPIDKTIRDEWRRWKRQWADYCVIQSVTERSAEYQASLFRTAIGPDAMKVLDTQPVPGEATADNVATLIAMMDTFVMGQVNPTYERYMLRKRMQQSGESIETFITDLKTMIKICEVPAVFTDELIKDQVIFGIKDNALRERLLQEKDLSLSKCIEMCKAAEAASSHLKAMTSSAHNTAEVSHITKSKKFRGRARKAPKTSGANHKPASSASATPECHFCGLTHRLVKSECPAWGKTCSSCGQPNHFARKCGASASARPNPQRPTKKPASKVHNLNEICGFESSDSESVDSIHYVNMINPKEYHAKLLVQGNPVTFLIDTGASTSLLPVDLVDISDLNLGPPKTLEMWNGSSETSAGTVTLKVTNPATKKRHRVLFDLVTGNHKPILGINDVLRMNLVTINIHNFERVLALKTQPKQTTKHEILQQYESVFADKIGTLDGEAHLSIDGSVSPVILPARNVATSLRPRVKKELKRMARLGVISFIDEHTEWASQIVVVDRKSTDRVRICIDPKYLNNALQREHYHLPTLEEILPELGKAKVFSKFDLRSGYWHVPLDPESRKLTCCQTPFGRFIWNRLPFGLKVSSEIFQKRVHAAISGLPGVYCIADDVLIAGYGDDLRTARTSLDENVHCFLKRCAKKGIVLNPDKFEHAVNCVPFMGHLLTSEGLKADSGKVSAILDMPMPADVAAVRRFTGTVTYLAKFLPRLSDVIKPLTALTCANAVWSWGPEQETAVDKVKYLISNAPLLRHYDPDEDLVVQCDASQTGLGACLMQGGQPLMYASRTMTSTEQAYAQIEKETLAIVFAMERFDQFTYGRTTLVQSDHKPLATIMKKPLSKAPLRLQRMLLRLQRYDILVSYLPGKDMLIADTLSRACQPSAKVKQTTFARISCIETIDLQPAELQELQTATAADTTLQSLLTTVQSGWPEDKSNLPACLHPYWSIRDEISHDQGLLLKGDRIIVPTACRTSTRDNLHDSAHLGIESCLHRARATVYWPNMNSDLKAYIQACPTCAEYRPAQPPEPMTQPAKSSRPWEIVSADIFTLNGKDYLLTVDHYSSFFEVDWLPTLTSKTVITKLKVHFSRYGLPVKFLTDNGRQFVSEEFESFMKKWKVNHVTSSPYYPKGNGTAEAMVKVAKALMRKSKDVYDALLSYRNTPKPATDLSPAQLFLMRRLRTPVPTSVKLLHPAIVKPASEKVIKNAERAKRNYDSHAKSLTTLSAGDSVRIKPANPADKTWEKGTVTKSLDNQSYEVQPDNGLLTRRNRVHLRPAETPAPDITKDSSDPTPKVDQNTCTRSGRVVKPVQRFGFE